MQQPLSTIANSRHHACHPPRAAIAIFRERCRGQMSSMLSLSSGGQTRGQTPAVTGGRLPWKPFARDSLKLDSALDAQRGTEQLQLRQFVGALKGCSLNKFGAHRMAQLTKKKGNLTGSHGTPPCHVHRVAKMLEHASIPKASLTQVA